MRGSGHSHCPCCGVALHVIGTRSRKLRQTDGSTISLIVRRFRCSKCGRIHHELPDMIVPYKRYSADCIAMVLTASDHPCEISTALRLRVWFKILKQIVLESLCSLPEIRCFKDLAATTCSPGSTENLLKFLVKKAANVWMRITRKSQHNPPVDFSEFESSI